MKKVAVNYDKYMVAGIAPRVNGKWDLTTLDGTKKFITEAAYAVPIEERGSEHSIYELQGDPIKRPRKCKWIECLRFVVDKNDNVTFIEISK